MIDFETGEYSIDDRNLLPEIGKENVSLARVFGIVAITFLIYFGVKSFYSGASLYAIVLFSLAFITLLSHLFLSRGKYQHLHIYVTIFLMSLMCLYLLYSGGESGSGPLWYYVVPLLSLFLLGLRNGIIALFLLGVASFSLIYFIGVGFDISLYSSAMIERFVAVLCVVTMMATFYEHSRNRLSKRMQDMYQEMTQFASTDFLTNLPNRRYLNDSLMYESYRANRAEKTFSIILSDIDYFKKINDKYGHSCGDSVLIMVSKILRETLRAQDVVGRWGGEEFLMILPDTVLSDSTKIAKKLCDKVYDYEHTYTDNSFSISMSFGVVEVKPPFNMKKYLNMVDECLYNAKTRGRNQVVSEIVRQDIKQSGD